MLCIDPKMPFIKYSKLFPLQKVKFLLPKVSVGQNLYPLGKKVFCAAVQGKQERAHGIKSELWLKKGTYILNRRFLDNKKSINDQLKYTVETISFAP